MDRYLISSTVATETDVFFTERKNLSLIRRRRRKQMEKILGDCGQKRTSSAKGFLIKGITYKGVTKTLASLFYANYKHMKKRRARGSSSKKQGDHFHRHVYHRYRCKKECTCRKQFGIRTAAPRLESLTERRLLALQLFLQDRGLVVYDTETIVVWGETSTATALDLLCVDNVKDPKEVVVIELKTGYDVQRNIKRTTDDTGMMRGSAGINIENTASNHHQLQLWFGMQALEHDYGIKPDSGVVLYFDGKTGAVTSEWAKMWWFSSKKMRKALRLQLMYHR